MDARPLLKDLCQCIRPHATEWRMIGATLNIPIEWLNIIEKDNQFQTIPCCIAMLIKWLEMDTNASWQNFFAAMKSCEMSSSTDEGD